MAFDTDREIISLCYVESGVSELPGAVRNRAERELGMAPAWQRISELGWDGHEKVVQYLGHDNDCLVVVRQQEQLWMQGRLHEAKFTGA